MRTRGFSSRDAANAPAGAFTAICALYIVVLSEIVNDRSTGSVLGMRHGRSIVMTEIGPTMRASRGRPRPAKSAQSAKLAHLKQAIIPSRSGECAFSTHLLFTTGSLHRIHAPR